MKKFLFHFIAISIIPLLMLGTLELGLRLAGYGHDSHFLIRCKDPQCKFWHDNPEFTVPFFSRPFARSALPILIPDTKPPKTYRIFVMGSSACAGYPIPEFSFSRILQVMLKAQFPEANIEVINVSNVAINSHVVRKIIKELASHKPDLFIIYMGNNEVIGPYGPGTVFAPFASQLGLVRANIYLNSTKIGQILQSVIDMIPGTNSHRPKKWDGLAMFVNHRIPLSDPRMQTTYRFYEKNLEDILTYTHRAGAKTILSTVGANLKDTAPFASLHGRAVTPEWNTLYEAGINLEAAGNFEPAIEKYQAASQIDAAYAELHFRLGRCYQALGKLDLAKQAYTKALDLDALRLRADTKINEIIRKVALKKKPEGVDLLDTAELLNAQSPLGIAGQKFLYEHVHLNFDGNYAIAEALLPRVKAQLPQWILETQKENTPVLSKELCAKYLGYTKLEELVSVNDLLRTIVNRPPFIGVLTYTEMAGHLNQNLEALNLYFKDNGYQGVLGQLQDSFQYNPQDPWIHYHLGRAFLLVNKPRTAITHLQFAVKRMPSLKDARRLLKMDEESIDK